MCARSEAGVAATRRRSRDGTSAAQRGPQLRSVNGASADREWRRRFNANACNGARWSSFRLAAIMSRRYGLANHATNNHRIALTPAYCWQRRRVRRARSSRPAPTPKSSNRHGRPCVRGTRATTPSPRRTASTKPSTSRSAASSSGSRFAEKTETTRCCSSFTADRATRPTRGAMPGSGCGWKHFTVVQWDQRGAGRTFGKNPDAPPQAITVARMTQVKATDCRIGSSKETATARDPCFSGVAKSWRVRGAKRRNPRCGLCNGSKNCSATSAWQCGS